MYVGRIVSDGKNIPDFEFFENIINTLPPCDGLPTLIVGKKLAESLYGKDKVKIIDRQINDNVTWCYSIQEKRSDYEPKVESFIDNALHKIEKDVTYKYVSITTLPLSRIKKLIGFMYDKATPKVVYINSDHVYIHYNNTIILGLSINECTAYFNVSKDKIEGLISKNKSNKVIRKQPNVSFRFKQVINDRKWLIPYLYGLKN